MSTSLNVTNENRHDSHSDEDNDMIASRGKKDPAWGHCTAMKEGRTQVLICMFCSKSFRGGGISRFKQHLAGITGNIMACNKVTADVRYHMVQNIEGMSSKINKVYQLLAVIFQCTLLVFLLTE